MDSPPTGEHRSPGVGQPTAAEYELPEHHFDHNSPAADVNQIHDNGHQVCHGQRMADSDESNGFVKLDKPASPSAAVVGAATHMEELLADLRSHAPPPPPNVDNDELTLNTDYSERDNYEETSPRQQLPLEVPTDEYMLQFGGDNASPVGQAGLLNSGELSNLTANSTGRKTDYMADHGHYMADQGHYTAENAQNTAATAQQNLEDIFGGQQYAHSDAMQFNQLGRHDQSPDQLSPVPDGVSYGNRAYYDGHQEDRSPAARTADQLLSDIGLPSESSPSLAPNPPVEEDTYMRDGPLTFGQPSPPSMSPEMAAQFDPLNDAYQTQAPRQRTPSPPPRQRTPTPPPRQRTPSPAPMVPSAPVLVPTEMREEAKAKPTPTARVFAAEPSSGGAGAWIDFKKPNPALVDLIYWRDPKKTAVVFGVTLVLLICFARYSVLSCLAYAGLFMLLGALGLKAYNLLMTKLGKAEQADPIKPYLEQEVQLPNARVHQQVDVLLEHVQVVLNQLRRLLLVEDIFETVKFGLLLWAMTYIGAWFAGSTLMIIAFIALFTIPKFYEVYKQPIDQYLAIAQEHVKKVTDIIQEKLPFLKKKIQ